MAKTINNLDKALAPSTAQKNSDITKAEIESKLTGSITSHKHDFTTMINCSNTDFDTIKTAGFYYGYTGMTNAAAQAISVLEVIVYSKDWIVQRQTVINSTGKTYERHYHSGNTWSTWKTIYDSKNKPTPADIGAATSSQLGTLSNLQTTNKNNLVDAINEVFQSGNSAKQELVAALVAKGLSATTNMTFSQLIDSVETGLVKPAGNAVAADVLNGKTFINSTGKTVTGTMTSRDYHTKAADYVANNSESVYIGIPLGAYLTPSPAAGYPEIYIEKTRLDANLKSANIVSGKSILGVVGNAPTVVSGQTFYQTNTLLTNISISTGVTGASRGVIEFDYVYIGGTAYRNISFTIGGTFPSTIVGSRTITPVLTNGVITFASSAMDAVANANCYWTLF